MPSLTPTPGQPLRLPDNARGRADSTDYRTLIHYRQMCRRSPLAVTCYDIAMKQRRKSSEGLPMRPCAACGWDVLVATAEQTGGYCFTCQWMTTREACSILRIHRDILQALGRAGKLTCLKLTHHTHRWMRIEIDHLRSGSKPLIQSHRSPWNTTGQNAPYSHGLQRDSAETSKSSPM